MKYRNVVLAAAIAAPLTLSGEEVQKPRFKAIGVEFEPLPPADKVEGPVTARLLEMPIPVQLPDELHFAPLPKPPAGVFIKHVSGGPDRGFTDLLKTAMLERGKGMALYVVEDESTALVVLEIDILISREIPNGILGPGCCDSEGGIGGFAAKQHPSFQVLATAKDRCGRTLFETQQGDMRLVDSNRAGPPRTAKRVFESFKKRLLDRKSELHKALQQTCTQEEIAWTTK